MKQLLELQIQSNSLVSIPFLQNEKWVILDNYSIYNWNIISYLYSN